MNGHHLRGFNDVVAIEKFTGCGMPRDVHFGVRLVNNVCPQINQPVDHAIDRVLIPWDQA